VRAGHRQRAGGRRGAQHEQHTEPVRLIHGDGQREHGAHRIEHGIPQRQYHSDPQRQRDVDCLRVRDTDGLVIHHRVVIDHSVGQPDLVRERYEQRQQQRVSLAFVESDTHIQRIAVQHSFGDLHQLCDRLGNRLFKW